MKFIEYETATGRILASGNSTYQVPESPPAGVTRAYGITADKRTHYIDQGVAVERPANPSSADVTTIQADGTDQVTVSGVPAGSTVRIDGPVPVPAAQVDDGTVEFTTDTPGAYRIVIDGFPERRKIIEVQADG